MYLQEKKANAPIKQREEEFGAGHRGQIPPVAIKIKKPLFSCKMEK